MRLSIRDNAQSHGPTHTRAPQSAKLGSGVIPSRAALRQGFIVDLRGRAACVRAGAWEEPEKGRRDGFESPQKPAVAAAISALMAEKHGVVGAALVGELGVTATFAVSLS